MKKEVPIKELEETVYRLEDARSNSLEIHDSGDVRLERLNDFPEVSAEIGGIEATLLTAESRMDEFTQVLSEEIDNLKGLLEKIEEDSD